MGYNYQPIWAFLLYSAAIGFLLGFVYDFFRAIRLSAKPLGKTTAVIITYICDLLFFLCLSVVVSIFIFRANNGRIRGTALLLIFVGLLLYLKTVGRIVLKFNTAVFRLILRVLRFLFRDVILGCWRILCKALCKLYRRIEKFYYFLFTRREMFRIITMMKKS